jgi:hypothetical protein
MSKPIRWTLEQGVEFIRKLEPVVESLGYHVGLTGGVLYRGNSTKDLDVIVYISKTTVGGSPNAVLNKLNADFGMIIEPRSCYHKEDSKLVFRATLPDKRRIDLFFMQ